MIKHSSSRTSFWNQFRLPWRNILRLFHISEWKRCVNAEMLSETKENYWSYHMVALLSRQSKTSLWDTAWPLSLAIGLLQGQRESRTAEAGTNFCIHFSSFYSFFVFHTLFLPEVHEGTWPMCCFSIGTKFSFQFFELLYNYIYYLLVLLFNCTKLIAVEILCSANCKNRRRALPHIWTNYKPLLYSPDQTPLEGRAFHLSYAFKDSKNLLRFFEECYEFRVCWYFCILEGKIVF